MSRFSPLALALAVPLTALSHPVLADLTPAQVWSDWRSYMEGMGYSVAATETSNGDTLRVTDITMSFDTPEAGSAGSVTFDQIDFAQNGDGSVSIFLPETMPMSMSGSGAEFDGEDFALNATYTQTGHAMTASGTPESMTYEYSAASVVMELQQAIVGDETLGADTARMRFAGTNLASNSVMEIGALRSVDQTVTLDDVTFDFFFQDPEDANTSASAKGSAQGIAVSGNGTLPLDVQDASDMAAMMAAGFDTDGTITYTNGSSEFDVKDQENGNFMMRTTSKGGSLGVKMGPGGLAYDVSQQNMNAAVQIQGLPIPFEVAMVESGFKLAMPVMKSDDPQDFALGITMGNFTMSDVIWGIFDPSGQLPRDPATILLDLSGKVKLLVDWMNPDAVTQIAGSPGEVRAIDLRNLLVSAAGAELKGSGAVTLDGAAQGLIPGVGTPVGDVNMSLAGGNGLLDKLVAMGILPQEQAMGARMMMGLFTVPGDAPDTLKSTIAFTADGQILANGQRIR